LKAGNIDGYCVGEPWNSRAVYEQQGFVIATDMDCGGDILRKYWACAKSGLTSTLKLISLWSRHSWKPANIAMTHATGKKFWDY
jgi:hypothetical protein